MTGGHSGGALRRELFSTKMCGHRTTLAPAGAMLWQLPPPRLLHIGRHVCSNMFHDNPKRQLSGALHSAALFS